MTEQAQLQGRILLAEDEENNQRLLSLYMRKMGLQVSHADNGAVAVKLAAASGFDLILIDMQMSVMPSVEAVRQIRASGQREPIIALTTSTSNEDRCQCIEAGCTDFLSMPLTRDRLYKLLAKYLNRQEPMQSGIEPLYSELSEQGPEFAELVNQFVVKLPELLDTIQQTYTIEDWENLRQVVHNLKGTGGGFGFPQLTEQAIEIEKLLYAQDYPAIEPIISLLHHLVQRIQAGLPQLASMPQDTTSNNSIKT